MTATITIASSAATITIPQVGDTVSITSGAAEVTIPPGVATVSIPGSGAGITVNQTDATFAVVTGAATVSISSNLTGHTHNSDYLRLDATNDPITNPLEIASTLIDINNSAAASATTFLARHSGGGATLSVNTTSGNAQIGQTNAAGAGEDVWINFTRNAQVTLRYDNSIKLVTTATGISVTDDIAVSGTVDGRDVAADGIVLDALDALTVEHIDWTSDQGATNIDAGNLPVAAITSGTVTGITDLAVADGGTASSTAQAAIDVLSAVSGATIGWVLTKSAGGSAVFEASAGGGGTPGGSDTELQFNNGGAFGSLVNVTYNDTTSVITIGYADELSGLAAGGTDIDALDLTIKVPVSTGTADPGAVIIQTTNLVGAISGTTPQPLNEAFRFVGSRIHIPKAISGYSVFIGDSAGLVDDLTTNVNVFIGAETGQSNTSGRRNTAVGAQCFSDNVSTSECVAIGYRALFDNIASNNTAVGSQCLRANTSGDANVGFGYLCLASNTTGRLNVGFGANALNANVDGRNNVAIGNQALFANISGIGLTAIGAEALGNNVAGLSNLACGYLSMRQNTSGSSNLAIGEQSLEANVTTDFNVAIGFRCLEDSIGTANVICGYHGAWLKTTGDNNCGTGHQILAALSTGGNNTAYGHQAGDNLTSGSNCLIIGYDVDAPAGATTSNQMSIGNLLFSEGLDGTGTTVSSGFLGIGEVAPSGRLHVVANGTTDVVGIFQGITSQTGDLTQWRDVADAVMLSVQADGDIVFGEAVDIICGTTTGTMIATATTQKIGFFGTTPVVQPTEITDELTSITHTAPGAPDYALQDLVDSGVGSAFGFATKDEGNTVLSVILNLQARVNELEAVLSSLGLVADAD